MYSCHRFPRPAHLQIAGNSSWSPLVFSTLLSIQWTVMSITCGKIKVIHTILGPGIVTKNCFYFDPGKLLLGNRTTNGTGHKYPPSLLLCNSEFVWIIAALNVATKRELIKYYLSPHSWIVLTLDIINFIQNNMTIWEIILDLDFNQTNRKYHTSTWERFPWPMLFNG